VTTATRTIDVLVLRPGSFIAERKTIIPSLAEFQGLVGGYIEALDLTDEVSSYINEEGKLEGLPRNDAADQLVRKALARSGRGLIPGDYVAGPLVLTGQPDDEGETTGVPESVIALLQEVGVKIGTPGEAVVTVVMPDPAPMRRTGRDGRSMETRLPTSRGPVHLEISTGYSKERRVYFTTAHGVVVGDVFTRYSLMDFVRIRQSAPVTRYHPGTLVAEHEKALADVRLILAAQPDAFDKILLAAPIDD
jgi:hypothetical protein